jgi:hypothetical protein
MNGRNTKGSVIIDAIGYSTDGVNFAYWHVDRLWKFAETMPVEMVPVASLMTEAGEVEDKDRDMTRVMAADLDYPIIIAANGWLMDGRHRVYKAYALGLTEIKAVRFTQDPAPDYWKQKLLDANSS